MANRKLNEDSVDNEFTRLRLSMEFMTAIEHRLDHLKMTRKELAAKVFTTTSHLTMLFRGDRIPSLDMLARIGGVLDMEFRVGYTHQKNRRKMNAESRDK